MFSGIPSETPLDLRFWLFGVHVRVHPLHWVFGAILGWDLVAGRGGNLGYLALWVLCVFLSVLLHELGHVLVGRVFGSDGHIILYSFGGVAIGSSDLRKRWQRVAVYFAGPLAQFVLLGLVFASEKLLLPHAPDDWSILLIKLHRILFVINLYWPVLNLLPIWPLDGGRISRELLEAPFGQKGVIASLWLSILLSGFLAVQVLLNAYGSGDELIPHVSYLIGSSMWTALFFAMFCFSSIQALQVEFGRRNRWDDELPWER